MHFVKSISVAFGCVRKLFVPTETTSFLRTMMDTCFFGREIDSAVGSAMLVSFSIRVIVITNTPGRTRTCNLRLRRPLLYPIELQAPTASKRTLSDSFATTRLCCSCRCIPSLLLRPSGRTNFDSICYRWVITLL